MKAYRHPCLEWDWNPRSQCLSERRQAIIILEGANLIGFFSVSTRRSKNNQCSNQNSILVLRNRRLCNTTDNYIRYIIWCKYDFKMRFLCFFLRSCWCSFTSIMSRTIHNVAKLIILNILHLHEYLVRNLLVERSCNNCVTLSVYCVIHQFLLQGNNCCCEKCKIF
jgi:hypothetical protein